MNNPFMNITKCIDGWINSGILTYAIATNNVGITKHTHTN